MIGQWNCLIIDCPDPRALATFYEELLGFSRMEDSPDWVTIGHGADHPRVAFQRTSEFRAPHWPASDPPQQMHVDVLVDNLDVAEAQVVALGAVLLEGSPKPIGYRVYADPIGHPFCLVTPESFA